MFISKFWTLLLALIIGVSLAVIQLGRDVVNRERAENTTAILYKEMSKVDVALKLHARKRLDVLLEHVEVGRDDTRRITMTDLGVLPQNWQSELSKM